MGCMYVRLVVEAALTLLVVEQHLIQGCVQVEQNCLMQYLLTPKRIHIVVPTVKRER